MAAARKRVQKAARMAYDEAKQRININVTPTATENLDEWARELGISRSELIERLGRQDMEAIFTILPSEVQQKAGKLWRRSKPTSEMPPEVVPAG